MPKRSNQSRRDMWSGANSAGKGDADRSPAWREHYDEVAWPDGGRRLETEGFIRRGGRLVKRYGVADVIPDAQAPAAVIH